MERNRRIRNRTNYWKASFEDRETFTCGRVVPLGCCPSIPFLATDPPTERLLNSILAYTRICFTISYWLGWVAFFRQIHTQQQSWLRQQFVRNFFEWSCWLFSWDRGPSNSFHSYLYCFEIKPICTDAVIGFLLKLSKKLSARFKTKFREWC